jgi:FtsP/CotA-like multicopper oxidase with cupredoxin domain
MRGLATCLALLVQAACTLAAPSRLLAPVDVLSTRHVEPRGAGHRPAPPSCHGPKNRACWKKGWDINTDYEYHVPYTGKTRKYTFTVTEHDNWVGPDGRIKDKAMLINGGFPGPTIRADWGDMIEVEVINQLELNGTSIHWHGIHMRNNAVNDGANGVTECPIPPGRSKKYHFLAEQYGTSWYHSHFSTQYANGVVGDIIIEGPASRNYDIDLGALQITDWYYGAADTLGIQLNTGAPRAPPPSDNIYFNGKAVGPDGKGGEYARMTLTPGKLHRLRIVNPSVDNTFIVSLVNHNFTVISTDFVPVKPCESVSSAFLGVGQRLDMIIDANQDVGSYWFNVTMDSSGLCGTTLAVNPAMIFDYKGAKKGRLPTINGTTPAMPGCLDRIDYEPIVQRMAPPEEFEITDHNDLDVTLATGTQTVKWNVHGHSINITWDEPTLEYVAKGDSDFPAEYGLITNPADHQWSFWLVQNFGVIPHPMHLHGHDFLVLGRSDPVPNPFAITIDEFNSTYAFRMERDAPLLDFENPTRRDVTMLPSWGWIVIAFVTDNPGAWLMHCHIAWHVSQGLGVQFLERVDDIPAS